MRFLQLYYCSFHRCSTYENAEVYNLYAIVYQYLQRLQDEKQNHLGAKNLLNKLHHLLSHDFQT